MLLTLIFKTILLLLDIYTYVIIAFCFSSFIPQIFKGELGYKIYMTLYKLSKPAFDLVNMIIPSRFLTIGMINLTPIIIFVGIHLIEIALISLYKLLYGIFL